MVSGGTEVLITGQNFNFGYGQIYCRFGGDTQVEAIMVDLGKQLACVTPVSDASELVDVKVSIDGGLNWIGTTGI